MGKVTIPYTPRPLWKAAIHPGLERARFSVVVAHRRFGKTVGMINHMLKQAVLCANPSPQYAYIAPFRIQAKQIAWSYLKFYTAPIPGRLVNESELFVELPSRHANRPGARLYIKGADNPDSLRGSYWDGVVLDEYAQIKPEVWNEIIRPALADRSGWAVFIGTPKGQNAFYEMYRRGLEDPSWYTCRYTVADSCILPEVEVEEMKKDMSEDAIRQELYCDFTASAFNVLISIDLVAQAKARRVVEEDLAGAPVVLGVDVARYGADHSCIVRRRGLCMYEPLLFSGLDNMKLAEIVAREIEDHRPDAVFIDAGRGEGVIDRLRQLGYTVMEVPFGGKAIREDKYVNRRAEMWDAMRAWLQQGGSIPEDERLQAELSIPEYGYDAKGRIQLEAKDKIKERSGRSPDVADAAALTFAAPVASRFAAARVQRANTGYSFF